MTLIDIYESWSGLEVLFGIVAIIILVSIFVLAIGWLSEYSFNKKKGIITAIMIGIAMILFAINTFAIPNYTYYKYYVTNMNELQRLVDEEGYIVTDDSSNYMYTIRKGEK